MSDWDNIISILAEHQKVILLIHEKPDGDCLGSALALAQGLMQVGKEPQIWHPEPVAAIYSFLPRLDLYKIQPYGQVPPQVPIIAVDCADASRLGYTLAESNQLINIDHHASNDGFGTYNIVDTKAAAAGEIVYRLLKEGARRITPEIATCLYVAISTDTGSFTYSNTTSATLGIASELLTFGAATDLIREHLHEKRPFAELITMKAALENLFISHDKKIIGCTLDYDTLSANHILTADTDGLIGMLRATDGVEVALLFKELEPSQVKVSLRSKSQVDVNVVARQFGGGGHPRAAGCTVNDSLSKVKQSVMEKTLLYLNGGSEK